MANRLYCAALAAVSLFLAACGGGDDTSTVASANPAVAAFTGPAVSGGTTFPGESRLKALAASAAEPVQKPVIDFRFVLATGGGGAAALAAPAPEVGSPDYLLDLSERAFPELFPNRPTSQEVVLDGATYRYRYHETVDTYIGVQTAGSDVGGVYAIGPFTGGALQRYETVRHWTCLPENEPSFCGPKLLRSELLPPSGAAVPAAGAVNVSAKGTRLRLTYDEALNCAEVAGTGVVGQIVLTVACDKETITFTPGTPGEERWPFGTVNTVTVGGLSGPSGYPSAAASVSFTTRSAAAGSHTRVFVANFEATAEGGHDVSMINAATRAVTPVNLGDTLNSVVPQRLAVDPVAGVVYVGAGGDRFYRVDLETGQSLTPLWPDPTGEYPGFWHTVQGLVIAGQDICAAMGRQDFTEYVYRNRLLCWDRFTLQPSFRSNSDYLAGPSMVVMETVAVPERNRFYVVAAEALAYTFIVDPSAKGTLKQEFTPGSAGTVYEVNADTKAVMRTFTVGAGPRGAVYDAARKRLIVASSGKTAAGNVELSLINLETGQVTAQRLPGFTGYQRPQWLVLARGELWVSDYVSAVVALDLATFAEKRRVRVGDSPVFFAEVAGKLYVPVPRDNKIVVVGLDTNSLTGSPIPSDEAPWYVAGFVPLAR